MSDLIISPTSIAEMSVSQPPTAPVLDIGNLPLQLEDLTRERIKVLPKPALQELSVLLAEMDRGIGHAREQLSAALDDLYGEAARAQLLAAGKDTGTVHLADGDLAVTVEIKKSVSWDQSRLAAIFNRMNAVGDDPTEYIDVKYSISERKFAAWPETLRSPFEAARTVRPGKASYRLASLDTEVA